MILFASRIDMKFRKLKSTPGKGKRSRKKVLSLMDYCRGWYHTKKFLYQLKLGAYMLVWNVLCWPRPVIALAGIVPVTIWLKNQIHKKMRGRRTSIS